MPLKPSMHGHLAVQPVKIWNKVAAVLAVAAFIFSSRAEDLFFDFGKTPVSEQPAGFLSTVSGEGKPGQWRVVQDEVPSRLPPLTPGATTPTRSVLGQFSRDITDEHYPLLVYTNEVFGDFTFSTRFKTVSGAVEQMAGIVFRYVDENNYYYVRASSKGSTFRFFKVVAGQRSAPIGPEIEIPAGVWQDLSVEATGNQLKFFLNGRQVIPTATDNSFNSGKIGFWTKSDSVSYFTEAHVSYKPRESYAKTLMRQMKEKYPRVLGMSLYGSTGAQSNLRVMAATEVEEMDKPATDVEKNVVENGSSYFGRLEDKKGVVVTMPVRDRNGDVIAALRVEMKSFLGQTENNALARALPIVKDFEKGVTEAKDLF